MVGRRRLMQMIGAAGVGTLVGCGSLGEGGHEPIGVAEGELRTDLTVRCRLRHPFVGAGMGFLALPELVAAVSNAGGLGVLGVAPEPPPVFQQRVDQIMALTDKPFGVDFFLAGSDALGEITVEGHIDAAVAAKQAGAPIAVVVFHFETPPAAWVSALQAAGMDVWAQVHSVPTAQAALAVGVDGLIAQGSEAGGHSKSTTPLRRLLRELRRATPRHTLILAAGGIATGLDVARALAHGADGVWVGTRLLASTESYAHPEYKQRVVQSRRRDDTVVTKLFGPELPCEPYRVLRNQAVQDNIDAQDVLCELPPDYSAPIGFTTLFPGTVLETPGVPMPAFSALPPTRDTTDADFERLGLPAGTSACKIRSVQPVARIVREMMLGALGCIHRELGRRDLDGGPDSFDDLDDDA
ncbi:MAG: nitronate monooxygenase [Sandaracinaceae bacterium]|nr:nitronate monooxygenase [Sandaracinaceae bacterium]